MKELRFVLKDVSGYENPEAWEELMREYEMDPEAFDYRPPEPVGAFRRESEELVVRPGGAFIEHFYLEHHKGDNPEWSRWTTPVSPREAIRLLRKHGFSQEEIEKAQALLEPEPVHEIVLHVFRQGHDGIAHGGSYGWYYYIYSDGEIETVIEKDESVFQSGHRINYHWEDQSVRVVPRNATWMVIWSRYQGQIYSFPDNFQFFGQVPEDWNSERFLKKVL